MNTYQVVDLWIDKVVLFGLNVNTSASMYIEDRLGGFAGFLVSLLLLPITMLLCMLAFIGTFIVLALVLILSPVILPFAIYKHIKERA